MSNPEEIFAFHVRVSKLPAPVREFRFHPVRRFRFDFCWPDKKIACEIDGGTHTNGRHNRGTGYEKDCYKMALAISEGWTVYRFTSGMVEDGVAIDFIRKHFARLAA